MNSLSYALVTPSYWMDRERCELLVDSVERMVAPGTRHYLVIAARDLALFKPLLARERTQLLVVEDIIPGWLIRLPGVRRFWLSLRTRPVKNWILQQIVKLSVPSAVREDVLLYADSDMFFAAAYDPRDFERAAKVPLFAEPGQRGLIEFNDRWQGIASRLLGLPVEVGCDINYVGQLISWRRDHVLAMLERVEEVTGKRWQVSVARLSEFSEYVLYGQFVSRVLKDGSGHWHEPTERTLCYWRTSPLDEAGLRTFKDKALAHHHSVMISAKSHTPVELIRRVFL